MRESETVLLRGRLGTRVVGALLAVGVLVGVSGCRQTSGLSKQEVVVVFKSGATAADHTRVYNACKNLPGVDAEPLVTNSKYAATLLNNVRYRVDHATNYQLQQLYNCIAKDPSVVGYKPPVDQGQ